MRISKIVFVGQNSVILPAMLPHQFAALLNQRRDTSSLAFRNMLVVPLVLVFLLMRMLVLVLMSVLVLVCHLRMRGTRRVGAVVLTLVHRRRPFAQRPVFSIQSRLTCFPRCFRPFSPQLSFRFLSVSVPVPVASARMVVMRMRRTVFVLVLALSLRPCFCGRLVLSSFAPHVVRTTTSSLVRGGPTMHAPLHAVDVLAPRVGVIPLLCLTRTILFRVEVNGLVAICVFIGFRI